jgi:hypothetical protein
LTTTVDVKGIDWTCGVRIEKAGIFTHIGSSEPFVKDHQQAIAILSKVGIEGFKTKNTAKIFAKTLPVGKWKYLKLTTIEKFVDHEMKSSRKTVNKFI